MKAIPVCAALLLLSGCAGLGEFINALPPVPVAPPHHDHGWVAAPPRPIVIVHQAPVHAAPRPAPKKVAPKPAPKKK